MVEGKIRSKVRAGTGQIPIETDGVSKKTIVKRSTANKNCFCAKMRRTRRQGEK